VKSLLFFYGFYKGLIDYKYAVFKGKSGGKAEIKKVRLSDEK